MHTFLKVLLKLASVQAPSKLRKRNTESYLSDPPDSLPSPFPTNSESSDFYDNQSFS